MAVSLLLVHTAADDREMYAEYFTSQGFRVIQAATTDEAIPLISEADVVITGLMVRGLVDPLEMIANIRDDPRTATKPVIVLTASSFSDLRDRARRAGADVVILKPCLPDALVAEVRKVLELRGRRD